MATEDGASGPARHPYAVLGGGTDDDIHNPSTHVPRPAHLCIERMRQAGASGFCEVVNSHQGRHRIYYELYGRGPRKLILIMGLAGTHAQFEPQIEHFGLHHGDEYTVCAVDNRGAGCSDAPRGRWRSTDLASDCLQLLTDLARRDPGWARGVHLLGMSMGGMAALELALLDPQRFGSLSLVATHAGGLIGTVPPLRGLGPLFQTFGRPGSAASLDAGLDLLFPRDYLDAPCDPESFSVWKDIVPEQGGELAATNRARHAFALIRRARKYVEHPEGPLSTLRGATSQLPAVLTHYVSWDRLERLRAYGLQVLVVSGARDNLVGHWNSRLLAEVLCGRWLHFADAGHGVSEQHAVEVNEAIEKLMTAAEASIRETPHLVEKRRPLPPGTHPLQLVGAYAGAAAVLLRPELLGRWLRPRVGVAIVACLMAVHLRRRFGGFFAR